MAPPQKRRLIQGALILSAVFGLGDLIYKLVKDISFINREQCVLFRALPRLGFIVFEYLFETVIVVLLGIFVAQLAARLFARHTHFYPRNPLTAFACAACIPTCACAAIPLVAAMQGKLHIRTTLAFVLAAPLLSPQIIAMSFTVLGPVYGLLRIASSFALVLMTVGILGLFHPAGQRLPDMVSTPACTRDCQDLFLATYETFVKVLPFLVGAALLGIAFEYFDLREQLLWFAERSDHGSVLMMILLAVPLYFCNGAEVFFLRPLVAHGFPIGTAIGVSLAATAVCITSLAMLMKFLGRKMALLLMCCVILGAFGIAVVLNALPPGWPLP